MEPLRGRCLCGDVRYAATASSGRMWHCYCRACAKTSGVGFGTWIEATEVLWESGARQRVRFAPSAELTRSFCGSCGSVLPAERRDGSAALLPAGGLDTVHDLRPGWHEYAAQRAPWLPAMADLPCHPASHDEQTATRVPCNGASPQPRAPASPVRGGCLCGAVTYAASPPMYLMRVCHCSRCRRHSGSSYFVGLACASSSLQILRGEALVRSWQLPDSARYIARFCADCGASVPSVIGTNAFTSAGSLDSDPGVRIRCHIYFASRASWTCPDDDLPRFDELPPPNFDWSGAESASQTSTTIRGTTA